MLKRLIGKLLIIIGCLSVLGSIAYQIMLLYWEFGGLDSGYLIVHWSLLGILGILLLPIGKKIISHKGKKEDKNIKNGGD